MSLKTIGLWLAKAAVYAAKGALYVSNHPEVVQAVGAIATLAGHPEATALVAEAARVSETVGYATSALPALQAAAANVKATVEAGQK